MFNSNLSEHLLSGEIVEVIFYFALAVLVGAITERIHLQREQNRETQIQLERTYRLSLMGQMAATMAHEIKNPLASIKGSVEILCNPQTNSSDKKEFESIVLKEIKRVDNTVKEYLNFARPKPIELKKINLSEAIQIVVKQIENQATKFDITLANSFPPDICINGDSAKIHQILLNLLLNAIEASPASSSINIKGEITQGAILLTLQDQGFGMTQTEQDKIFDPFYTTKETGSGLGLAVVKSIIDGHNGSIKVDSTQNQGTTFNISLPIYNERAND